MVGHTRLFTLFVAAFFLSGYGYLTSGTWQDDPDNWERAFRSGQPDNVTVVQGSEVSLHDDLVRGVSHANGRLEVLFRAGDQEGGYFDARLRYGDVELTEADEQFLKTAADRPDIELLYDEFDSSSKGWVHRMLFWPYQEISVHFAAFDLKVAVAAGRFDSGAA